jgi:mono/diheme cytochrome c family protein
VLQVKLGPTLLDNIATLLHNRDSSKGASTPMHTTASKPYHRLIPTCVFILLPLLPSLAACQETVGEALYLNNCAQCHQPNGKGIPNVYPALASNKLVNASAVDVALVLLIGRGEMPSFAGMIPNAEIAAIVNYVRNAWGNEGEIITQASIERLQ